jgi:CheY-like chemotaxis protein
VSDGAEALEYIYKLGRHTEAPRPDLILLDLNMPRLGGREVAAKLKADPSFRSIPIVAFTTSVRAEDVAYCYTVGVNSYVQKPSDFEMLESVLHDVERYWLEISQRLPSAP